MLLVTFVGLFMTACAQQSEHVTVIEPATFKTEITTQDVQLVDVRTAAEYSEGYIEDAENIDVLAPGFEDKFSNYDKDQPIYIYCRSGSRSQKAAAKLVEMGFKDIYDLKGGYLNWTN